MDARIECPHCKTSYTAGWCGVQGFIDRQQPFRATIACAVCKKAFEVSAAFEKVQTAVRSWRSLGMLQVTETIDETLKIQLRNE